MGERREATVMLTHSARGWAQRLHFHLMDHGGALMVGYALSADDIAAAMPDAVVLDDVCSFASRSVVDEVGARGTRVVGVYDPADGTAGSARLAELGIELRVASDAPVESFLSRLASAKPQTGESRERPAGERSSARDGRGALVVVAGAGGGTGATEIAAGLAGALARRGAEVVVADADVAAPGLAPRFALPVHPNLNTAIAAVAGGRAAGGSLIESGRRRLKVLAGSAIRSSGREARATEVVRVLESLATPGGFVVADVGSGIEDVRLAGAGPRFGVARSLLAAADGVVLVAGAGPMGTLRVARWLDDASGLVEPRRLHIVVNKFPRGGFRSTEVLHELLRVSGAATARAVPQDPRVDRASWQGTHLARGPFARRLRRISRDIAGIETTR